MKSLIAYNLHKFVAVSFLAVVLIVCSIFKLFGYEDAYWICVFFFGLVYMENSIQGHEKYGGYGVAREINTMLGGDILEIHGLVLSRHVPHGLFRKWTILFLASIILIIIGSIFNFFLDDSEKNYPIIYSLVIVSICCLLGEIYFWFAVNRRRLWYCNEITLRKFLGDKRYSRTIADEKVSEAKEAGLIAQ